MRAIRNPFLPAGLAAVFALGLAACSDSSSPATPALSAAQADSLGEVVVADVQSELDAVTMSGAVAFNPFPATVVAPAISAAPGAICMPARSPVSPGNADGDRVPDSVRLDFTGCVVAHPLFTDTISGTIDVIDPTPTAPDHAVKRVFTDFRHVEVNNLTLQSRAQTLNGVRQVSRDSSMLSQSATNFRTDYVFRDGSTATHVRTWTSVFTADVAGAIRPDTILPSGTWNIAGTSSWTRGSNTWSLTVTTNPALHYDAGCTVGPKFDAGTVTAVATRNGNTSTVTIQFTACGQFTVTRS